MRKKFIVDCGADKSKKATQSVNEGGIGGEYVQAQPSENGRDFDI
jgi:hypothetical protein